MVPPRVRRWAVAAEESFLRQLPGRDPQLVVEREIQTTPKRIPCTGCSDPLQLYHGETHH